MRAQTQIRPSFLFKKKFLTLETCENFTISNTLRNISFKEQIPKKSKDDPLKEKNQENFEQILDEATFIYRKSGSST